MIVSAVADPTAFGPDGVTDELSKREAIAFLQGIMENGVLLDSPTKELIRQALECVGTLSTKMGQRIQLLLVEIQKQHKKIIVTCDKSRWQSWSPATVPEKCSKLASSFKADAVVTQSKSHQEISNAVGASIEVLLVSDVSQSTFEDTRRRVRQVAKPLDELKPTEIEELIGRATKYAATVRFFDYRMVGSRQRTTKYLAGIRFVATIWENWCVVGDASSRCVELYTVGDTNMQGGYLKADEAKDRLETLIQQPLDSAITANVNRFVKRDEDPGVFHTRGFEAHRRAFTIDPGFDAIGDAGPIRSCILSPAPAAELYFTQCRGLKDLA